MGIKKVVKKDGTTAVIQTGQGSKGIVGNLPSQSSLTPQIGAGIPETANPYIKEQTSDLDNMQAAFENRTKTLPTPETDFFYTLKEGANPYEMSSYEKRQYDLGFTENSPYENNFDGSAHKVYITPEEYRKLYNGNKTIMSSAVRDEKISTLENQINTLQEENDECDKKISNHKTATTVGTWTTAAVGGMGTVSSIVPAMIAGSPIAAVPLIIFGGGTAVTELIIKVRSVRRLGKLEKQSKSINEKLKPLKEELKELKTNIITPEEIG